MIDLWMQLETILTLSPLGMIYNNSRIISWNLITWNRRERFPYLDLFVFAYENTRYFIEVYWEDWRT